MTLNAQRIARQMVTEYGMSKTVRFNSQVVVWTQVFLGKDMQGDPEYSGQIAYEIDKKYNIIKEQYERCKDILLEHKSQLNLIAESLLTEETLVAERIRSLFYGVLPEVDYDSAKVVENEMMILKKVNTENHTMKFVEQSENNDDDQQQQDDKDKEDTGHEQSPNIDKPSNPSDPNDPSNRN